MAARKKKKKKSNDEAATIIEEDIANKGFFSKIIAYYHMMREHIKKRRSFEVKEKFDWLYVLTVLSFRNKVVSLSLVAITLICGSLAISLTQPTFLIFKIGGYTGILLMVYVLVISFKNTKDSHFRMRKIYLFCDIIYALFTVIFFLLITVVK